MSHAAEETIASPDDENVEATSPRVCQHLVEPGPALTRPGHPVIRVRVRKLPATPTDQLDRFVGL